MGTAAVEQRGVNRPAVVPPVTLAWFPKGTPVVAVPGDLLFARTPDLSGKVIRFGEGLRGKASWTNHSCVCVVGGYVAQATARGIILTPLAEFDELMVCVAHPTTATPGQVAAAVAFAEWCVGIEYGWWSLPFFALDCLTAGAVGFSSGEGMVCSTHACRTAERWGLVPDRSPWAVMPSTLAGYFGADSLP
jgi:hypothetical protein